MTRNLLSWYSNIPESNSDKELQCAIENTVVRIVRLTQKDAELLLKLNTHNRKIKDPVVMRYAVDMNEGRWKYNGVPIIISDDNQIIDGQHRLLALGLCDPGTTIIQMIVNGISMSTQSTVDQNTPRTLADVLTLDDFDGMNTQLAAGIRFYYVWNNQLLFTESRYRNSRQSKPAINQWVLENQDLIELFKHGMHFLNVPARNGIILALYVEIARIHGTELADVFMQNLQDGIGLESGSPILALRNRLINIKLDRTRVSDRDILGYMISGFNHWRKGHKIARMQKGTWTKDSFPELTTK